MQSEEKKDDPTTLLSCSFSLSSFILSFITSVFPPIVCQSRETVGLCPSVEVWGGEVGVGEVGGGGYMVIRLRLPTPGRVFRR